jgi:MFS family permease
MYLSTRSLAAAGRREASEAETIAPAPVPSALGRNVLYLGLTSMFTDVSSEMITSVLPLYLTLVFGFGPFEFGVFDGAFQGLAALAAIAAAIGADRGRRHKLMAGVGYVISAVCTAGLIVVRGAWLATVGMLYLTRLGKGIRTAPRDAIISMSVGPHRLGRAFGVHRAFDTVGAVAGPVLGYLLLARDPTGYGTIFAVGFFVAVIGVAVLVVFVEPVGRSDDEPRPVHATRAGRRRLVEAVRAGRAQVGIVWSHRGFRAVVLAGASLAVVRPVDSLLYLAFQRDTESGLSVAQFPLVFSIASVMFLVFAVPLGLLADRIGKLRVYVIGELAVAGALAVVASGARGTVALMATLALVGLSYAATDGVLVALASATLPERWRTTGLAVLAAVIAAGRFLASAGFGALWERYGDDTAALVYLIGTLVAAAIGFVLIRREDRGSPGDDPDERMPGPVGRRTGPTSQLEAA